MLTDERRRELQDWLLLAQLVFFVAASYMSARAMLRQLDRGKV